MTNSDPVVIVGAARTPIGGFLGDLSPLGCVELGAAAIRAAVARAGIDPGRIDEVAMGCVLPAGLGQAPARQASRGAGLPDGVGCTTLNKMCGSGMKTVMLAHDQVLAGGATAIVAGGMESMSNAPYLLDRARTGYRMGHGAVRDHMFLDGLEDAYDRGRLMGTYAEDTARHYGLSRAAQDAFAITSLERARQAQAAGRFAAEIVPLTIASRKGETVIDSDEQPRTARPDRIPTLKPAFCDGGTVTAANSSSISDGAAALVLMRRSEAERQGLTPRAVLRGHASFAHAPAWFTTAPVNAIRAVRDRVGWDPGMVDLYEINEAFAVVTLAAIRDLQLDAERVNIHGGACALGHPIGASGTRVIVTLLAALEQTGQRRGIAALCIGGGEATAVAVERL